MLSRFSLFLAVIAVVELRVFACSEYQNSEVGIIEYLIARNIPNTPWNRNLEVGDIHGDSFLSSQMSRFIAVIKVLASLTITPRSKNKIICVLLQYLKLCDSTQRGQGF